jgi:NADH-quinone oxidoreductase subunit F
MDLQDHTIAEKNPLGRRGCLMGATGSARTAYIYVRDELHCRRIALGIGPRGRRATSARSPSDRLPARVVVHTGAGAYICGEETALLSSLEGSGRASLAAVPAQAGAFRMPSTVSNP